MRRVLTTIVVLVLNLSVAPVSHATYLTDIGFDALQAQLGSATPTGAGMRVAQVESPINDVSGGASPIFMPNSGVPEFAGKTITPVGGNASGAYSDHATSVGALFYGNATSVGSGITQIDSYHASSWVNSLYNPVSGAATISPDRVTNHSWVGGGANAAGDSTILRLVDRQVALNESIHVVGMANEAGNSPLLGSAYNVIAVGRTDGVHQQGSVAVPGDILYGAGRVRPDIVAPQPLTSLAAPVVSAAAALLVQTGHEGALNLSNGSTYIAGIGTIYNAERSETVKAALMAGADRVTANTSTTANITDYGTGGHGTANGLDDRYGAGQVNIASSYRILTGGEQRSVQSGGSDISLFGFDHANIGGLSGTGRTASYFFNAQSPATLVASLVWNVSPSNNAQLTTQFHNLDLFLYDVTTNSLVASSASLLDNTENIYFHLLAGNRYELRVTTADAQQFLLDYALAWRMAPVPLPPAVWLFASGVAGLLRLSLRRHPAC